MDYRDQEYLNLFKQIQQQKVETKDYNFEQLRGNATSFNENQMIREVPNYNNFYNEPTIPNINEVQRSRYSQDMNLNEFAIETRVNGQLLNEVKRQEKDDRLNEVMENLRKERLNEVKKNQELDSLNEVVNFKDSDVITLEMFEKARYNSMMTIARRILPK